MSRKSLFSVLLFAGSAALPFLAMTSRTAEAFVNHTLPQYACEDGGSSYFYACPVLLSSVYPTSNLARLYWDFSLASQGDVQIRWTKKSYNGTIYTDSLDVNGMSNGFHELIVTANAVKSAPSNWDYSYTTLYSNASTTVHGYSWTTN